MNYAHVLVEVFFESFWGYPFLGMKRATIKSELGYIEKINNELLNRLCRYQADYHIFKGYEELKNKKERENFLIDKFSIRPHFEVLEKRKRELTDYLNIFSSDSKKGRSSEKKYKLASIWAAEMRTPKKIYWSKVLGILDWFFERLKYTAYGNELKIRDNIKERSKYLKNRCLPLIKKDTISTIVRLRMFFPSYISANKKIIVYSINFKKNSIEVSGIHGKIFLMRKIEFRKDKKFFTTEYSTPKHAPLISFPNGEVYEFSPTRDLIVACINYLPELMKHIAS